MNRQEHSEQGASRTQRILTSPLGLDLDLFCAWISQREVADFERAEHLG